MRGNKFEITLRGDIEQDTERLEKLTKRVKEKGIPNFYGTQRFGYEGRNIDTGFQLFKDDELQKRIRSKKKRSLFISCFQSLLFNEYLIRRMKLQSLDIPLPGERWTIGGSKTFVVSTKEEIKSDQAVCSGPIFGSKFLRAEGKALELEESLLKDYDISEDDLARNKKLSLGTRRALWVHLDDLETRFEAGNIVLSFSLPSGSYALNVVSCFIDMQ